MRFYPTHNTPMSIIERYDYPADHPYYRTSSSVYNEYLRGHCSIRTFPLEDGTRFGWIKNIIGRHVQLAKFERIDTEPTRELLAPHGWTHGMVIWIPFQRRDIPPGWRKLAVATHFTRIGFVRIDDEKYSTKWNERAQRARKKFLAHADIRIESVDPDAFIKAFSAAKVRHLFKSDYVKYYQKLTSINAKSVRSYLCYHLDQPIAGLAVHDYNGNSSVHLVAFTSNEARPYQAGTGLIDRWFADSVEMGIRYINFDHLQDSAMSRDQKGYTDFKMNFVESECYFKDSYFRFM
ncbi:MAG: GNAT family N-acetyltransferase [Candidatus Gracilibacteria bacterium]|nr:GNAT family N-acetyltransferase [Candidatus Gracilibacteria bacterium]